MWSLQMKASITGKEGAMGLWGKLFGTGPDLAEMLNETLEKNERVYTLLEHGWRIWPANAPDEEKKRRVEAYLNGAQPRWYAPDEEELPIVSEGKLQVEPERRSRRRWFWLNLFHRPSLLEVTAWRRGREFAATAAADRDAIAAARCAAAEDFPGLCGEALAQYCRVFVQAATALRGVRQAQHLAYLQAQRKKTRVWWLW
jgi:hypothetical protein